MAEPEEAGLVKCVESLLTDKQAMAAREKKLIEDLNVALAEMGLGGHPKPANDVELKTGQR